MSSKDYIIQSILIPTTNYSVEDASDWVVEHGYKIKKIHSTVNYHRFRQHTPKYCKSKGCTDVKTIPIGNDGIKFIVYYCDELIQGAGIYDTGKALIFGRTDYNPSQKKLIEKYGSNTITHIKIGRSPLPSFITGALDILTFGAFKELLRKSPYDKLYHLFMIITLDNGVNILAEKNQGLNIKEVSSYDPKNTEYIDATYIPSGLTFKELLDNGKQVLGNKYFPYDATKSNCQQWIRGVLQGSSILTKQLSDFVYQDVATLFKDYQTALKVVKGLTDIGSTADILITGGSIPENMELYEEVKKDMDNIYDKPSAYKSGAIVKEYKRRGGTYKEDGKPKNNGLVNWFKSEWKNISPNNDMYPTYRPTKRVNKNTPLTVDEIPIERLKEQIALKQLYRGDKNLPKF